MTNHTTSNCFYSKILLWLLLLNLFLSQTVHAYEISGLVVTVSDGDTLTLLTSSKKQVKIRLADIDAPEKNQPFGLKAKQLISKLTYKKHITVEIKSTDRYGRSIGHVYSQNMNVNEVLVEQGLAWVYRKYSNDQNLIKLETLAKQSKSGVWAVKSPIAPWDWRKGYRAGSGNIQKTKLIIGNEKSKIYHLYNCRSYHKVSKKNQQLFSSEKDASNKGFRKAGDCP